MDGVARGLGLRAGMPVAQARALVPDLIVVDADPARDLAALNRLGEWMLRRYSPIVALDPPDGLRLDATGCAHFFPSEAKMLADMVRRLAAAGIAARGAMAGAYGAAHALARHASSPRSIVAIGAEATALASLPIAAMRLDPGIVDGLRRLGFDHIGQLLDVPRAPFARRFGPDLYRRLDQALDLAAEPIEPIEPIGVPMVRRAFIEPVWTPEPLARAIGHLAEALCRHLTADGLGARRLDLALHRIDARIEAIRVGMAAPVRDPIRLARLLCDRLDRIDPGPGVELMVLSAPLVEPFDARQVESDLAGHEAPPDLAGLVDTLSNRLGPRRLFRMAPVESEVPERGGRRLAPLAPPMGQTWPVDWQRPTRLLTPPEPIATFALLPDHPPAQFTWRGDRHHVMRADGPERIFGEWWRRDAELVAVRDYFQVEDERGARFWVYRAGDGVDPATGSHRWFLHGLFA